MSAPTSIPSDSSFSLESWRTFLRDAAKEVFAMMLGAELKDADQPDPTAEAEVTAMVGLAGPISGVLSLRCSAAVSIEIAGRMLGLTGSDAESHRCDAVGETCNMVAGAFKAKLSELQNSCMLSVPTVITGNDYAVHPLLVGNRMDVPFLFDGQVVCLSLEISD